MTRHDHQLARKLYATESPLEAVLALHIKAAGLPDPEREFRFRATRKWKFDFCWPDQWLAVEVEGGTFSGGRHVRGKGFELDCEKYNAATVGGWRVLRYTSRMIESGQALQQIEAALNEST